MNMARPNFVCPDCPCINLTIHTCQMTGELPYVQLPGNMVQLRERPHTNIS